LTADFERYWDLSALQDGQRRANGDAPSMPIRNQIHFPSFCHQWFLHSLGFRLCRNFA
jgi:hypothetical protein